jgi:hypothetical protein
LLPQEPGCFWTGHFLGVAILINMEMSLLPFNIKKKTIRSGVDVYSLFYVLIWCS